MSATNHTTTIELSQYISTDKPTYLTDYNGDMLKIDNAIAADRDSISTAQNKANTADGKADANKLSIDTLNAQINGDPTDPSDTGLAGDVNDNSSDIETMQSLIGNGTPTTSNQTIIGAINGLEGAVAPREDSANLANSYAIGEQFARGGSVYTALTSLTAGTAFASLTLNTDYKNSDTLVEQIAGKLDADTVSTCMGLTSHDVTVTADGVKTYSDLFDEIVTALTAVVDALGADDKIVFRSVSVSGYLDFVVGAQAYYGNVAVVAHSYSVMPTDSGVRLNRIYIANNSHVFNTVFIAAADSAVSYASLLSSVPADGAHIVVRYDILTPILK